MAAIGVYTALLCSDSAWLVKKKKKTTCFPISECYTLGLFNFTLSFIHSFIQALIYLVFWW
jgi:hypothetical protein